MKHVRMTSVIACLAAALLDAFAFLVLAILGARFLTVGIGLHALALVLVGWMPPAQKQVQRSAVELRIGQVLSFAVPVIGPLVALMLRTRSARSRRRMQDHLVNFYAEFLDNPATQRECSPFRGEFDNDVERLSDAESFATVLRYGAADHKRGVLRRVSEHEGPQSAELLRHCLASPDGEIALFAYSLIDQREQELTAEIAAREARVRAAPDDEDAQAELAEAHRALARSGVLDQASSRWHEQEGLRIAAVGAPGTAPRVQPDETPAAGPQANLLARAERAFAARDLETVAELAEALVSLGADLPVWLRTVQQARRKGVRT